MEEERGSQSTSIEVPYNRKGPGGTREESHESEDKLAEKISKHLALALLQAGFLRQVLKSASRVAVCGALSLSRSRQMEAHSLSFGVLIDLNPVELS
jgi:hypothetical protein